MSKNQNDVNAFKEEVVSVLSDFYENLGQWWDKSRKKLSGLSERELEQYDQQFERTMNAGWKKMEKLSKSFDEELEKDNSKESFLGACKRVWQGMKVIGHMIGAALTSLFLELGGAQIVDDPKQIIKGFETKIDNIASTKNELKSDIKGAYNTATQHMKSAAHATSTAISNLIGRNT